MRTGLASDDSLGNLLQIHELTDTALPLGALRRLTREVSILDLIKQRFLQYACALVITPSLASEIQRTLAANPITGRWVLNAVLTIRLHKNVHTLTC